MEKIIEQNNSNGNGTGTGFVYQNISTSLFDWSKSIIIITPTPDPRASERPITFTPEQSAYILEHHNNKNRTKKSSNYSKYSRDMADNAWKVNGDTVAFYNDGNLANGQHRFEASVRSGKSFTTFVVFGIAEEAKNTIDCGAKRSVTDNKHMAGVVHGNLYSPCANAIVLLYTGNIYTLTEQEIDRIIAHHPRFDAVVEACSKTLTDWSAFYGTAVALSAVYPLDVVLGFIDGVVKGVGLEEGNPCLLLRDALAKREKGKQGKAVTKADWMWKTLRSFLSYYNRSKSVRVYQATVKDIQNLRKASGLQLPVGKNSKLNF